MSARTISIRAAVATSSALAAIFTAPSPASDIAWINPAGGEFHDPANWEGGVVPGVADTPVFNLRSTYIVMFTRDAQSFGIDIRSDDVTFELGGFECRLGIDDDGGSTTVAVGAPGETASLTIRDGSLRSLEHFPELFHVRVGSAASSNGELWLEEGAQLIASEFVGEGDIMIGGDGTGLMLVGDDSRICGDWMNCSVSAGSLAIVEGSSVIVLSINVSGLMLLIDGVASGWGGFGIDGEVILTSGSLAQLGENGGPSGSGTLQIQGGSTAHHTGGSSLPGSLLTNVIVSGPASQWEGSVGSGHFTIADGGLAMFDQFFHGTADVHGPGTILLPDEYDLVDSDSIEVTDDGLVVSYIMTVHTPWDVEALHLLVYDPDELPEEVSSGWLVVDLTILTEHIHVEGDMNWSGALAVGSLLDRNAAGDAVIQVDGDLHIENGALFIGPDPTQLPPGQIFIIATARSIAGILRFSDGAHVTYCANFLGVSNGPPADLNCTATVNASDLAQLLGSWGDGPGESDCPADFDGSGFIDAVDLAYLLGAWTLP